MATLTQVLKNCHQNIYCHISSHFRVIGAPNKHVLMGKKINLERSTVDPGFVSVGEQGNVLQSSHGTTHSFQPMIAQFPAY